MAGSWSGLNYIGDATNETVTAFGGNERLFGGEGDDNLFGAAGNDYLDGGVGNDVLDGGDGDDVLIDVGSIPSGFVGLIGRDVLRGGNGNDELRVYSPDTGDVANGGAGFDTLLLQMGYFSGFTLPPGTAINFTMGPGGAASIMQVNGINTLSVSNIERLIYSGVNAADFITGAAGDDIINGGDGDDHLFGGDGNDQIDGGTGVQDLDGGNGFDTVSFNVGGFLMPGLTITNAANINLGVAGSLRNFEAFRSIVLGNGNNIVNLTQTGSVDVYTGGGNDRITVLNAAANVYGGFGNDVITTGIGNDYVEGADGDNTVRMGDGADYYRNRTTVPYTGTERIWGEAGDDIVLTAGGADMVDGGTGDDELYTGWGDDRGFGGTGNDSLYGEAGGDTLYGGDGNDFIDAERDVNITVTTIVSDYLDGGLGNDWLIGGLGLDRMFGGDGDDTLQVISILDDGSPDTAVDQVLGGLGNDNLKAFIGSFSSTDDVEVLLRPVTFLRNNGVTVVDARQIEAIDIRAYGSGTMNFEGGANTDTVVTGQGNARIVTFAGNDFIETTAGSDTIYAGDGDDNINQVQIGGSDLVYAGNGNDTVRLAIPYISQTMEAGASTISGGAGNDILYLYNSDRVVTFTGNAVFVDGVKLADVSGFEQVFMYGQNNASQLNGFAGNDTLFGAGGNDTINGLAGDDSIDGGANDDLIYAGAGNDTVLGGGGADSQYGGAGNDSFTLTADGLADVIDGGLGLDKLTLGFSLAAPVVMTGSLAAGGTISTGGVLQANLSGIDYVSGFASLGNDVLIGGTGNDSLFAYSGADTITTGAGDDTITASLDGLVDLFNLGPGLDRISLSQSLVGDVSAVLGANMQVQVGGVLVSTVQGADEMYFYGGSGNDTLGGGALNDLLSAGFGANLVTAGDGADNVSVSLDLLADSLDGGLGLGDLLSVFGNSDAMTMDLSVPGHVRVKVGAAVVVDATGFESLTVYGGFAGALDDLLLGIGGNDVLSGNAGDDTLFGGGGDDLITGGDGLDVMAGGAGLDRFVFSNLTQAPGTGPVYDRINDFTSGADLIDLLNVDANSTVFGNDAFSFIGAAAFGNAAGQVRYQQDVLANRTLVQGDVQGDGVADFVIHLVGLKVLQATDFVL